MQDAQRSCVGNTQLRHPKAGVQLLRKQRLCNLLYTPLRHSCNVGLDRLRAPPNSAAASSSATASVAELVLDEVALGRQLNQDFNAARFRRSVHQGDLKSAMQQVRALGAALGRTHPASASEAALPPHATPLSLAAANTFAKLVHSSHHKFFSLCLRRGKLDWALEYAKLLPPDPQLFTPLLKTCLDHGDLYTITKVVEVSGRALSAKQNARHTPCAELEVSPWSLQVRTQAGIPEDAFCYSALLKAAAREENAAKVEAIFDQAWQRGVHEPSLFNAIISQHNKKHDSKVSK